MTYFLPSPSARITTSSAMSDQVREAFFGSAEIGDADPQEENDDAEADDKARPIKRALSAEHAPAEAVDDADHGIEAVPKAPGRRHDVAREAHRRNVEPELHDERDYVAKISVFDIERRDQKR